VTRFHQKFDLVHKLRVQLEVVLECSLKGSV
jgi:hypothetical protein